MEDLLFSYAPSITISLPNSSLLPISHVFSHLPPVRNALRFLTLSENLSFIFTLVLCLISASTAFSVVSDLPFMCLFCFILF